MQMAELSMGEYRDLEIIWSGAEMMFEARCTECRAMMYDRHEDDLFDMIDTHFDVDHANDDEDEECE